MGTALRPNLPSSSMFSPLLMLSLAHSIGLLRLQALIHLVSLSWLLLLRLEWWDLQCPFEVFLVAFLPRARSTSWMLLLPPAPMALKVGQQPCSVGSSPSSSPPSPGLHHWRFLNLLRSCLPARSYSPIFAISCFRQPWKDACSPSPSSSAPATAPALQLASNALPFSFEASLTGLILLPPAVSVSCPLRTAYGLLFAHAAFRFPQLH